MTYNPDAQLSVMLESMTSNMMKKLVADREAFLLKQFGSLELAEQMKDRFVLEEETRYTTDDTDPSNENQMVIRVEHRYRLVPKNPGGEK